MAMAMLLQCRMVKEVDFTVFGVRLYSELGLFFGCSSRVGLDRFGM